MLRFVGTMMVCGLLMAAGGCSICSSPFDDHYPAYGGKWERHNANRDRVGSAFSEGGYQVDGESSANDETGPSREAAPESSDPRTPAEKEDEAMSIFFEG